MVTLENKSSETGKRICKDERTNFLQWNIQYNNVCMQWQGKGKEHEWREWISVDICNDNEKISRNDSGVRISQL